MKWGFGMIAALLILVSALSVGGTVMWRTQAMKACLYVWRKVENDQKTQIQYR